MKDFTFYAPTYFEFGKDAQEKTGQLVKSFGGSKVLFHYGGGSIKENGAYDTVMNSLKEEGLEVVELGGVLPNPRSGLVYEGIRLCKEEKIDFILAVGGGSVIDSAKAISIGGAYEGDFWDYFKKGIDVKKAIPVGTVLTIAAAGSEGSPNVVITHENGMLKRGARGEVLRPKFSILNPAFSTTLSLYQTACGITDIMIHICERYFTNTKDVEITDRMCEAVLKTMISQAKIIMKTPHDYQARANIMWAGMVAHNNICGVGREQDWASHGIEHELSGLYDCPHGAGLAVIAPAWMKYVMDHDVERFAQFATRVWGCEMDHFHPERTAKEGIARLKQFLRSIGMPLSFQELGASEEDIPKLVQNLGLGENGTIGNFVKLNAKDVEAIYRLAI